MTASGPGHPSRRGPWTLSTRRQQRRRLRQTTVVRSLAAAYVVGGVALFFVDARAAAVWIVNGLFFGAAAIFSYSGIRSLAMTVLFVILFVAHGIGAPLFFLREQHYTVSGWTAVGRFDFTIVSFFEAYTPAFVFCTLLLLAGCAERALFRRRRSTHGANVRSEALAKVSSVNDWKLFLFSVAMCALNYWMYVNNVDISGIPPVALPFKLTGALHYLRQEISAQNLNPRTILYTVTAPVSSISQRSMSRSSVVLYGLLFLIISTGLVVFACLVHARFRRFPVRSFRLTGNREPSTGNLQSPGTGEPGNRQP